MRYFYEERADLHVIAAGSLLEFLLADHDFSMPVGRVEYLHLGPMDMEEFLLALGQEPDWLAEPVGEVEVTVVRVREGFVPKSRAPSFVHIVALPDGSEATFTASEIYKRGERLTVGVSRGRLTGRVWLAGPYRPKSAPGGDETVPTGLE